jgi:hypothetical protein
MPRMLDQELLGELDRRWREQSPALVGRLDSGLADAEIDLLAEPLGYTLPEEVRRWFRWHNGSTNRPIIFTRAFMTLADAVSQTLDFAAMDETLTNGWLHTIDEKPYVVFDCRGEANAPAPVWHFEYSFNFDHPTRPVFESIGDMVAFWIELIDDGQIFWNTKGDWGIRDGVPDAITRRIWGVPTD